jgi:hypothetical protein
MFVDMVRAMVRHGALAVRLDDNERNGILRAVTTVSQELGIGWRRILFFGSRSDVNTRGGDIDLLIELPVGVHADVYRFTQKQRLAREDELGEQKIDLVIDDGSRSSAFVEVARERGVELWIND